MHTVLVTAARAPRPVASRSARSASARRVRAVSGGGVGGWRGRLRPCMSGGGGGGAGVARRRTRRESSSSSSEESPSGSSPPRARRGGVPDMPRERPAPAARSRPSGASRSGRREAPSPSAKSPSPSLSPALSPALSPPVTAPRDPLDAARVSSTPAAQSPRAAAARRRCWRLFSAFRAFFLRVASALEPVRPFAARPIILGGYKDVLGSDEGGCGGGRVRRESCDPYIKLLGTRKKKRKNRRFHGPAARPARPTGSAHHARVAP